MENIVEFRHVSKRFPGVLALDDINLEIRPGEVHALVGENGAGKSTIIKILTGAHRQTAGDVVYKGQILEELTPSKALGLGICAIYQEFNLMPTLTVQENVFMGRQIMKNGFLNKRAMRKRCLEVLDELGIALDPNELVRNLSVAHQQIVEICRALVSNLNLLIMDEPTAPLTKTEIGILFEMVRKLRQRGITIIYISHRLEEIFEISDRVTVFRDGKLIDTSNVADTTRNELIRKMVGRDIVTDRRAEHREVQEEVLRIEDYTNKRLHGVSLNLHKGEILGIAGMVGAGRTEMLRAIFGADPISKGKLYLNGRERSIKSPQQASAAGLGFVTEDRKTQGLFLLKSLVFNISYPNVGKILKGAFLNTKKERAMAERGRERLQVRCYSVDQLAKNLSGGNQQKLVLAKWLEKDCDILLVDEPTRGIDVGAKQEIYRILEQLAGEGKAILVVSSEMAELITLCERILIMREGKITAELNAEEITQEAIMQYAVS